MSTLSITPEQKENLFRLAKHLRVNVPLANFNMIFFIREYHTLNGSRIVKCAAAYGPEAGVQKTEETWTEYILNKFGFDIYGRSNYPVYLWCFSADWYFIDNTPSGAAKRIFYLLEKGLPQDWKQQLKGSRPLCY